MNLPRGLCPICRANVAVRRSDLVREHRPPGGRKPCAGSGAAPCRYLVGTIGAGQAMHVAHAITPVHGARPGEALCRFGTRLNYTVPATIDQAREQSTCATCRRVLEADERAVHAG